MTKLIIFNEKFKVDEIRKVRVKDAEGKTSNVI